MMAYASDSGAVMFIPAELDRTIPRVTNRISNDNQGDA
jgi:hypothetical protein